MARLPFDDANMPLFTVGQVADMLQVQQAFLRRLDEFRVVRPTRSAGGQRRYTRNEIVVVRYVVELLDDGLTWPPSGGSWNWRPRSASWSPSETRCARRSAGWIPGPDGPLGPERAHFWASPMAPARRR